MSKKIKQIIKYAVYIIVSTSVYGLIMYLAYTGLAGFSLLLAYLGNLVLIIVALVWDELNFKVYDSLMHSKQTLEELKTSRTFRYIFESFISFKAALYLFYVLIMILSQIVGHYPTFMPDNLASFIAANEYSILLLVAVDLFSRQFKKDRKRAKAVYRKFEKAWSDDQE